MNKVRLAVGLIIVFAVFVPLLLAQAENASTVSVFFSPEDDCVKAIVKEIESAEKSIDIAMYSFTSRPLSSALIEAVKRGIDVKVCLDQNQKTEKFSKAKFLENQGAAVGFKNGIGCMHNKFCIIDKETVITGSYNWTASADMRNDENLLVIKSKPLAEKYSSYFSRLWKGEIPDEKEIFYTR